MTKLCAFFFTLVLCSSCATFVHKSTTDLDIRSNLDSVRVSTSQDTSKWYTTPVIIPVKRAKQDIVLIAKRDSLEKAIVLKSSWNEAFLFGNLFSGFFLLGYAVDMTNSRRFSYPRYVDINFGYPHLEPRKKSRQLPQPQKHLTNLKISIAEGNHFYVNKGTGYGNSFGFLGITTGLEYYITNTYSLSMDGGFIMDVPVFVPASVHYDPSYQTNLATFADFQVGRDYKRFHIDGGIQYNYINHFHADENEADPSNPVEVKQSQHNAGLALSGYYKLSNWFNLGLNYYPSVFAWDQRSFQMHYSHVIFFELILRLDICRPKSRK